MAACELCGYEGELVNAIVEGTMLSVCKKCSNFGDVIELKKPEIKSDRPKKILIEDKEREYVVQDYSNIIKEAREKLNLKQEDLAKEIKERESIIQKLETSKLMPSMGLAKKLEKFLKIKLIEEYEEPKKIAIDLKNKNLTIGDLVKIKNKARNE